MRPRASTLLAALALLAAPRPAPAADAAPQLTATTPGRAYNWKQRFFTKEGYPSLWLTATTVRPVGADQVDLTELNITVFSSDASAQVETSLLSPAASYFAREQRASGPAGVRLIDYRDNCDISGEDWTYEQAGKKVSIHRNVHVVYKASLNGLAP